MSYSSVVISSGHSKHVRGASGVLDEVNEARDVVNQVAAELRSRNCTCTVFHDDVSTTQNANLNAIVNFHNKQKRELDISVHFNAYQSTDKPMGTEVLYVTQESLARQMSDAIASNGFINRGAKKRTDLFFLNSTTKPAILIEVCFVDSKKDAEIYRDNFVGICRSIADLIGGHAVTGTEPPPPVEEELPPIEELDTPRVNIEIEGNVIVTVNGEHIGEVVVPPPLPTDAIFTTVGKCSYFGGPDDTGVSPSEGLAFIFNVEDAPHLFLPSQPPGTSGLARRLNPYVHYVACRWDYAKTPKPTLLENIALVRATKTGITLKAFPADWGPNEATGRIADLSPSLMDDLGIETDDEVEVIYPYVED